MHFNETLEITSNEESINELNTIITNGQKRKN